MFESLRKLVPLRTLDDIVEDQDGTIVSRIEYQHVLVFALLVVENLLDPQGHSLSWPHLGFFSEPAIWYILALIKSPDTSIVFL
jgi:hypothetical protein